MKQSDLEFGTDPHLLTRTNDPQTSHDAGQAVDTTHAEEKILNSIRTFSQENGCTSYDIFLQTNIHPWSITPRIPALERRRYVYYRGDTRKGRTNRQMRIIRVERRKESRD
jgi:hypothetical protein